MLQELLTVEDFMLTNSFFNAQREKYAWTRDSY